jgi:curved DNA-binding protein CbpA
VFSLFMNDRLISQLHPDKNRDDPDAEEKVSPPY